MMTKSIGQTIVKNVLFNTVGRFYGLFVNILLTPYIIHSIGSEKYGLWVIVGVITGYFGLLDFGVGSSFTKYIAEFHARKDIGSLNKLVNTGLIFYGLFGVLIFLLSVFSLTPILQFFNISASNHQEVYFLFLISIALFAASNTMSSINTLLWGFQRMGLANKIAIIGTTLTAIGAFIVLKLGYGLLGLIGVNVIVFITTSSFDYYFAKRIVPELSINPRLFRLEMLKKLLGFGIKMQVGRFADLLSFQAHKLLMSKFVGLEGVTMYQVGAQVATQTRDVPLLLLSSLLPAVSEMHSLGEKEKLRKLYLKGSKDLAIFSVPLAFFFIVTAPDIIQIWIGGGFDNAAVVVQILALGYLANVNMGVASSMVIGSGKPEMQMRAGIVTAIATVVLNTIFAIQFGFIGVPVAMALSLLLGAGYFYWEFSCYLQIEKIKTIISLYLKPTLFSLPPAVFLLLINNQPMLTNIFQSRLIGLPTLLIEISLFFLIYGFLLLKSGYVESEDISLWKKSFQFDRLASFFPFIKRLGRYLNKAFPHLFEENGKPGI